MPAAKGSARTPLGPKKLMIIVVPSCLKDADGARTRSDQNVPKIVATFVSASSQGQRTHSARTNDNIYTCVPKKGSILDIFIAECGHYEYIARGLSYVYLI